MALLVPKTVKYCKLNASSITVGLKPNYVSWFLPRLSQTLTTTIVQLATGGPTMRAVDGDTWSDVM